jgi:hypothetical protein
LNAGIIYVHIFYLKCLWEGFKTPHFAHKIGESGLAGVERKNVFEYLLFKMYFEGIKTPRFANKMVESKFSGVGRNNIVENVLFDMLLGRHENTKFCT